MKTKGKGGAGLSREQLLELYYWMRLTRTLEERLVALYRQTKVVGGLFRSLGQEADAVGSTFALERRDIMSPLIRNLGAMLVKGATPLEILRQYMAKGDSPTRGRELNIHFGESITLASPNFASRPSVTLNAPPNFPMSSPMQKTFGSRSISSNSAWRMASR